MSKILIIRPQARAADDVAACRQHGWEAVPFCPMEIEVDEAGLSELPQAFAVADAVFWVSPTAVETAAPSLDFSDGHRVQFAVGQASQKALAHYCSQPIAAPMTGNDSEAVLQLPQWDSLPQGANVLIVRGHGGRDFLAQALRARGLNVTLAEVYFRRLKDLNWQDFRPEEVRAAYITSGELVRALFAQIPPQFSRFFKTLLYFTHHPRVAEALRQAGAEQIQVVAALDAAALAQIPNGANMSQAEKEMPDNQEAETVIAVNSDGQAVPSEKKTATEPKQQAKAAENNTGSHMSEPKPTPAAPAAAPVIIKQSSGKGLAAGALILALLGLGASGFLFVQGQNVLKNQELAFSQKIDKAALGESENAALLRDNLNRQTTIQEELARLNNGQKTNSEQIALSQKAYQELLRGRVNWLVDEAETMLNLAAQQLLLSGNVQGAAGVLEHVNSRLSRFDQSELLPIKQAVSNDLAALKNRPYVDISGTALRIDRLETAVSGLPLVVDGTLKPNAAEKVEADATLSWWENAWEKSLGALKGLVEVRRLDNNDAMLLAPEQMYFVRENLRLRLLDARTALMQRNGEVYQSDLNNVEAAVKQYFDNRSPATQSWLKELAELKALDVRMVSDDVLRGSLAAVRAYQDGARVQASLDTAASAVPEASASAPAQKAAASAASAPAVMPEAPALPSENTAKPQEGKPAEEAAKPQSAPKADKTKAKGEAA